MVEPSCSVRCLTHVSHCIRSQFHVPCIQAFGKLKFLFSCGANSDGVKSRSHVHVMELGLPVVIVRRFPCCPAGVDIGFIHMRSCSSLRCIDCLHFSSRNIELLCALLLPTQVGIDQWLSDPCLLSRLRGPSQVVDSVSASSRMLVNPSRSSLARSFVPSVSRSAPHNISKHTCVASGHRRVCQKNATLSSVCLTMTRRAVDGNKNPLLSSQTASGTHSHRRSVAHVLLSPNRFRSPSFKRFTADFDNCGTLPITTIGFRSSSVAQHLARPAGSLRLQPVLRSSTTSGSMSNELQLAVQDFCHLGRFTTHLSQSHHLTLCQLDGSALWEVLQTLNLAPFLRVPRVACTSPLAAAAPLLLLLLGP